MNRWEVEQGLLPVNQRKRIPQPPDRYFEIIASGGSPLIGGGKAATINTLNQEAYKVYND
jgi:hypothetical protein